MKKDLTKMSIKELKSVAKDLKNYLLKEKMTNSKKVTLKDILLLLECTIKQNYEPMFSTKLYNVCSVEYCTLLSEIAWNYVQ